MASIAFVSTSAVGPNAIKDAVPAPVPPTMENSQMRSPPLRPEDDSQHGHFSIEQFTHKVEIYSGSVAAVYKAVDSRSGGSVVIKVYHKDKMQPKHHHKLLREIEAMERMNGPYVAQLYGTFSNNDSICLVMEHCQGGDLFKSMMKQGGRMEERYVCVEIIAPLLRVLEKMHSQCMMHRDIKPENIFLSRSGRMRLGDFGLAMDWTRELPFSRSGTLDYMAPEVLKNPATQLQESVSVTLPMLEAKGIKPITAAVDVWAAGVLAYELVCGRPPFEVDDEVKTVTRIIYSTDIRFPEGFSPALTDFVTHALTKDPAKRPNAHMLLSHPWIQTNIQAAIACAPSLQHRQAKQELLRPLPIVRQALQNIPAQAAVPVEPVGVYNLPHRAPIAVATLLTPQAPRSGNAMRQLPFDAMATPQANYLQRQSSCPSQQMLAMLPPFLNSTNNAGATYRASPLSRLAQTMAPAPVPAAASQQSYTPTKAARPPSALARSSNNPALMSEEDQQAQHQWQLQQARQQLQLMQQGRAAQQQPHLQRERQQSFTTQLEQMHSLQSLSPQPASSPRAQQPQATSAPGTAPAPAQLDDMLQQRAVALSDLGAGTTMDLQQIELMLQRDSAAAIAGGGATGLVQVTRGPVKVMPLLPSSLAVGSPPVGSPLSDLLQQQQAQRVHQSPSCMALLQRLCIPGISGTEEGGAQQASPGPAGPGIKERMKWHLARQAGRH